MKIASSRSADRDLLNGFQFYKTKGDDVAIHFLDSLLSDIDSLLIFAGSHRQIWGFYRAFSKRFPFAIYYKIDGDVVRIRRVLDCRRNPDGVRTALR